jgi:hypothetical protein
LLNEIQVNLQFLTQLLKYVVDFRHCFSFASRKPLFTYKKSMK